MKKVHASLKAVLFTLPAAYLCLASSQSLAFHAHKPIPAFNPSAYPASAFEPPMVFKDDDDGNDKGRDDRSDKLDKAELAEQCKALSLKIDWLGRYQDRPACSEALNGITAYYAAHYIAENDMRDAKAMLQEAMIKISYAIDINCYGQEEMKQVLEGLKLILDAL